MRLGIEPKGVDFVVEPTALTNADRAFISEIIAHYKATGEIKRVPLRKTKDSKPRKKSAVKA